jgi:hypothetical protein
MKNLQIWIVFSIVGLADSLALNYLFDAPKWASFAVVGIAMLFPLYADLTIKEKE